MLQWPFLRRIESFPHSSSQNESLLSKSKKICGNNAINTKNNDETLALQRQKKRGQPQKGFKNKSLE
jgi:hypothetical protein